MGGDILSETSNPRQVTFSNVTDIRNRTLSGTSVEDDDDAPAAHQGVGAFRLTTFLGCGIRCVRKKRTVWIIIIILLAFL